MKSWNVVFLLFFVILVFGTCLSAEMDVRQMTTALTEVLGSFSLRSEIETRAILERYINPRLYRRTFGSRGLNRNDFGVEGETVYCRGALMRGFYTFKLDDCEVVVSGNTGAVSGYVNGTASLPGRGLTKGPWRLMSCWYKNGTRWYIEHLSLSKMGIPKLEYYPQLPTDFNDDPNRKWPLIVFLHGVGERGGTLDDLRNMKHSIPLKAATTVKFPFVVVSPLCPAEYSWSQLPYSIDELLDEVIAKYPIDPDRIYLTGLSLGGIGTWSLAIRFPDRFAAIAPVCGYADPAKVDRIKNLPVWAFHGAQDPVISIDEEIPAIEALKKCGGNIRYTIYPEVAHDAWVRAYATPELYDWFLSHKRRTAQ